MYYDDMRFGRTMNQQPPNALAEALRMYAMPQGPLRMAPGVYKDPNETHLTRLPQAPNLPLEEPWRQFRWDALEMPRHMIHRDFR